MMSAFEYQLLSTICNEPGSMAGFEIRSDHFEDSRAGQMFEVVSDLIAAKKEPDIIMLTETLDQKHPRDANEWYRFVGNVLGEYPSVPKNVKSYAEAIKESYRKRQIERIAQRFMLEAKSSPDDAMGVAINALRDLNEIGRKGLRHVSQIVKDVMEKVDRIQQRGYEGVKTGITKLDNSLGGLQPGDYCVLAARTSVGKTATMCNFAVNADVPVGIISAEQGEIELTQRLMSIVGRVNAQHFRTGKFNDSEYPRIMTAVEKLAESQIYMIEKPAPQIDDIEQIARQMQWQHDIGILFIDYIQKVQSRRYTERYLQVGDVSRRLYALAHELNIPVMALAQLNRNADGKEPKLSDLREAGDLEQDPDVVLLLHPDDKHENMLRIIVAKNRNGPQAFTRAVWIKDQMRLENPAWTEA